MPQDRPDLRLLVVGSGAAALAMETLWMRRLALEGGSTGLAATATLAVYMGALGAGAALAPRLLRGGLRTYGRIELGVAAWVVVASPLVGWLADHTAGPPTARMGLLALVLLGLPGMLHGATLPVLARHLHDRSQVAGLYAWNTAGAVIGTLLWTFVVLPATTVRIAEWSTAALAAAVGLAALSMAPPQAGLPPVQPRGPGPWRPAAIASLSGCMALAVEVCAARVGALLVGGSVYAFALVLAIFLTGIAIGGAWARDRYLPPTRPLLAMSALVLLFCASWRVLPHGIAATWALGGEALWLPGAAGLFALGLGPVAVASGATFTACLEASEDEAGHATGRVLAANTVGSVLGASLAGLVGLPWLGVWGTTMLVALLGVGAAAVLSASPRWRTASLVVGLGACAVPRWDPALYAVGLGLRVSEFADLSVGAVEDFAHSGWTLLESTDGPTTTVAVGRSDSSGNIWLSLNGKVDASTGRDMATQELSGVLPVQIARLHHHQPTAVVVGLASGVTAARTLSAGAASVTVLEIEPAVVSAARHFSAANADLLHDPRATVVVADARAWLRRDPHRYPVIISEPSNPWLTGVSNLFTREYWALTRERLAADGVFCQWIQLYALPPEAFQGLVRTFLSVYPRAWLFESIPGADALLIAAPDLPDDLPLAPTLGPEGLAALASLGPLVTDDHPWVEFTAPFWLHRATGQTNRRLIEAAAARTEGR